VALAVATALVDLAGSARAGGAATDAYSGIDDVPLDVHGLADLYLAGNFQAVPSGTLLLRPYDFRGDRPSLGQMRLTFAHKPEVFGFRLDVGVGGVADGFMHFDPASTDHPGLTRGLSYAEQAFVSAIIPLGRGLEIDVGKFGTPVGIEDNEASANWNYSRSLLYFLAEPSYHVGVRVTYPVSETFAASLFWENGWDVNLLDGNGMRAFAAAATWDPTPKLEFVAVYMGGPERQLSEPTNPTLSFRNELDLYARYQLSDRISLAGVGDYGRDASSGGASWGGVGGYLRIGVVPHLAAAVRGEHYLDGDGFTSGTKQHLDELTTTIELRGDVNAIKCVGRLEYRRDQSNTGFFPLGKNDLGSHQDTLGASLVASF
jgi:hypothetical protein